MVRVTLLVVLLVVGATPAHARPLSPPWRPSPPFTSETASVTIGGVTIDAEIADTSELRERGLSYRDALEPGTGMLFVYPSAASRSFWMYEMRFCLDIIWIADGHVVGAAQDACPVEHAGDPVPTFRSPEPVQFVVEVDAGWMSGHGIVAGAPVAIDAPPSVDLGAAS